MYLFCLAVACVGGFCLPAVAGAYATLEGPPVFSAALGLPDGRIYEQVSPVDKNGNEAGAGTAAFSVGGKNHYGLAAADGNSVLFEGSGPMGESPWGASQLFVATKRQDEAGWGTRALLPADLQSPAELGGLLNVKVHGYLDVSADLTHGMAEVNSGTLAHQHSEVCYHQLYLTGPDPFVEATWLAQTGMEDPVENCAQYGSAPAGGSRDFSTVYFTYAGTLLPEDASRSLHAGAGESTGEAWGFYEYREGVLREAGVLPDGALDPYGAVPAASWHSRSLAGNQVSADGTRAFFVSPDPASCEANGGHNDCAVDPPELYVREDGERTQLVSRDVMLPEVGGLPTAAPAGVLEMPNSTSNPVAVGVAGTRSFVFGSPNGSPAFFQSADALTVAAEEASPGSASKTYDFDVDTGALTYLPGVVGQIVATDNDGSSLAFVRPEEGGSRAELELWTTGPGGGSVTPIAPMPEPGGSVPEARMSSDGSVLVFMTGERLSGSFNSGGDEEIYRYDVPDNTLGCVSCPSTGIVPRGNASFSIAHTAEVIGPKGETPVADADERGISSSGDRIFFESPDPLVPQDANTNSPEVPITEIELEPQGRDVYEWEDGVVYLISTGKSQRNSFLLDNSENGDDVFFATTQGLVPGDTDGGYDVYDARVPQPGDNPAPVATPCSECQGPASVSSAPAPPVSASVSGPGSAAPEASVLPPGPKKVQCKKGYVRKKSKCVKASKRKSHTKRKK